MIYFFNLFYYLAILSTTSINACLPRAVFISKRLFTPLRATTPLARRQQDDPSCKNPAPEIPTLKESGLSHGEQRITHT